MSTKLYMLAMAAMMAALPPVSDTWRPKADTEKPLLPDLDILRRFDNVKSQPRGPSIQQEIERLSKDRDVFPLLQDILSQNLSNEQLQSSLFDLLGFEEFDLISRLVQEKPTLHPPGPSELESKAIAAIEARKRQPKLALQQKEHYPHVFKKDVGNVVAITGKQYVLPEGTTRASYPTHEELIIPYAEQHSSYIAEKDLIRIKDLDRLCQGTFPYKTLNKMQSLVYPVAYKTQENMLVCAPTGAGKTDVALLAILQTIGQFSDGDVDLDAFKIVYVAPLKALAAEIVAKYAEKLRWLGIRVRELTGDMQLLRAEIAATQLIVTTPEKWDVVTRKLTGDADFVGKVRLLVIDEVHLLHEERGSVIETLVARTLRQVESTQQMIRVVGLSATLPNYMDVADFLGVNRRVGMFYFDQLFRPCPLKQQLVGVRGKAGLKTARDHLDVVLYEKLVEHVARGAQVMVFVHLRKDTAKSCRGFVAMAQQRGELALFEGSGDFARDMGKHRAKDVRELYPYGFGVHHAGMLRLDRNLTEQMFLRGAIRVLCCTATLAWGVNLPAAVVIIKGTQVYDARQGGFVDLGISDVLQIFGRAGRPQFETYGLGVLCTTADRMDAYVLLLTQQHPIELRLERKLTDVLNAEIALGTVTTVQEGVQWLGYTYLYVRMMRSPQRYGAAGDAQLVAKRHEMVVAAARRLQLLQMVVFDEVLGLLAPKDLGRVALDFYLLSDSVEVFALMMRPDASAADVLAMLSVSAEFDGVKFRDEEKAELDALAAAAPCQVAGQPHLAPWKTNVLLQAYVLQTPLRDLALVSDCNYVAQNAARICRALFLVGIHRRWGAFARTLLAFCILVDRRLWPFDHPLAQFGLPEHVARNLRRTMVPVARLRELLAAELGDVVHNAGYGPALRRWVWRFPHVAVGAEVFPVTSAVARVCVALEADFVWDRSHGHAQFFWVTAETPDGLILHVERLVVRRALQHAMEFMVPLAAPPPLQLVLRVVSDLWLGAESVHAVSFQHLVRPDNATVRTRLLPLQPLPVAALHNRKTEALYPFRYFNPMQTMVFHSVYHSLLPVFVGAPTGLGKTLVAELAVWRALREPGRKVVYIAPMKALVRERVDDWRRRLHVPVVELTGDSLPDAAAVRSASVLVTTPEKFDGISRHWATRRFVQAVLCVIMDEIHLLASDRGPILEMIASRMNYMAASTQRPVRLVGMSTAVCNAVDMAAWLRVRDGLFNFPQSVRPVPLQMYIDGFPDNLPFCPLMKTMNKPAFMAIKQHSPDKPVLVFVASRRQTRLTALDLIHLCGMELNPRRFLKMDDAELHALLAGVKDDTLRLSLQFGIGLHHAGLVELDRRLLHRLFEQARIQILVATSTLAWGVNLPAHLVIIKGTQFFDAKIEDYRDMDLTDILQMMGRAGRPAFDTSGIAIVYTKQLKKVFYKHFLNSGFPVELSLHKVLDNHLGAEIASGTIRSRQQAMDFLTWTFLYRRAHNNPTYYGIEDTSPKGIAAFFAALIDKAVADLEESSCVVTLPKNELQPTPYLKVSSFYYLSHLTVRRLLLELHADVSFDHALRLLCLAAEYSELPTRHGEELINTELSAAMRFPAAAMHKEHMWDPHVKAFLLLQAYLSRTDLPITDYVQDTVSVLDQALRILQAYVDIAAEKGFLKSVLTFVQLMQCIKQRLWHDEEPAAAFGVSNATLDALGRGKSKVAAKIPVGDLGVAVSGTAVEVALTHVHPLKDFRVHAPHFPKAQRESWFVLLSRGPELLVLKRMAPKLAGKRGRALCVVQAPGAGEFTVTCVNDAMALSYSQTVVVD